jgi:hypothetical protein
VPSERWGAPTTTKFLIRVNLRKSAAKGFYIGEISYPFTAAIICSL